MNVSDGAPLEVNVGLRNAAEKAAKSASADDGAFAELLVGEPLAEGGGTAGEEDPLQEETANSAEGLQWGSLVMVTGTARGALAADAAGRGLDESGNRAGEGAEQPPSEQHVRPVILGIGVRADEVAVRPSPGRGLGDGASPPQGPDHAMPLRSWSGWAVGDRARDQRSPPRSAIEFAPESVPMPARPRPEPTWSEAGAARDGGPEGAVVTDYRSAERRLSPGVGPWRTAIERPGGLAPGGAGGAPSAAQPRQPSENDWVEIAHASTPLPEAPTDGPADRAPTRLVGSNPPPMEQIARAIATATPASTAAGMASAAGTVAAPLPGVGTPRTLQIALQPAELGTVDVVLSLENGILEIEVKVDRGAAADAVIAEQEQLRQALADAGLDVGQLVIEARRPAEAAAPSPAHPSAGGGGQLMDGRSSGDSPTGGERGTPPGSQGGQREGRSGDGRRSGGGGAGRGAEAGVIYI